eukprot:4638245-Alexandrium_andersonii.AAC.1
MGKPTAWRHPGSHNTAARAARRPASTRRPRRLAVVAELCMDAPPGWHVPLPLALGAGPPTEPPGRTNCLTSHCRTFAGAAA